LKIATVDMWAQVSSR